MRKSPNPAQMTIWEVADALGYTKTGGAPNSPLRWWRADVEEYLREVSGRGIDGAA
jgi:hypothetical protein